MRISESEIAAGRDTVDRVALVLQAVAEHPLGIGLTELTAATGMKKATVHRIADRLLAHELLQLSARGYQLGLRFFEWSRSVPVIHILRAVALPAMADLAASTGLTVELGVCDGRDAVVVERIPGRLVDSGALPARRPALDTAMGLVILAFSSPKIRRHAVEASQEVGRPVDTSRLDAELAEVRRRRFMRETGRFDARWWAAFAPIVAMGYLGSDSYPACAAIGVIGPVATPHVERATPLVFETARRLSRELSALPSQPLDEWPIAVVPRER
jgi:DNA-binding IclR family transcriptional regulator